jgi:phosphatidylserine decarboxylase
MFRFHREGFKEIGIISLLCLGALILSFPGVLWDTNVFTWLVINIPLLMLLGLILNFFRDPIRKIKADVNGGSVLAPCDGKVVVIERVLDTSYFNKEVLQISIFMSPLDVHVNRAPISGRVIFYKYYPGKFLVAWHPKSSQANEQTLTVIRNEIIGREIGVKQIAGILARRIKNYVVLGQELVQGDEFGFIKFGSRVDVLIPGACEVMVKLGMHVSAGKDKLVQLG